jgi:2-methylfumaryl-CoA isomerase
MVVAISLRQWESLVEATGIAEHLPAIERALGVDLRLEGDRFRARDALAAFIAPFVAVRTLAEVSKVFDDCGVCWGPYQTFRQLLDDDWRASKGNPMFEDIIQPGLGEVRAPGSPLSFGAVPRTPPDPAPMLGQHTVQILAEDLRLSDAEIGRLHDAGIVASPTGS